MCLVSKTKNFCLYVFLYLCLYIKKHMSQMLLGRKDSKSGLSVE